MVINLKRAFILVLVMANAMQAAAGAALSIIHSNSAMYLAWMGESDLVYQVEHMADLTAGVWSGAVTAVVGSGQTIVQAVPETGSHPMSGRAFFRLAKTYPAVTGGMFEDMLTPVFYNVATNDPFRGLVNRFIYYARQEVFHHPLEDPSGQIPSFTVPAMGVFGATKPILGPPQSYHPATDMHVGNGETAVSLFAAHDGTVSVCRDAAKYRHCLAVTKAITDAEGQVAGRISTIYGHIDLDLDEADGLHMHGQTVAKGDPVSKNLYSGTMGGPHLHFEVRYYRAGDTGSEEFYGGPLYSEPSSGPWLYGYWDPLKGYGFAHPGNHGLVF